MHTFFVTFYCSHSLSSKRSAEICGHLARASGENETLSAIVPAIEDLIGYLVEQLVPHKGGLGRILKTKPSVISVRLVTAGKMARMETKTAGLKGRNNLDRKKVHSDGMIMPPVGSFRIL